MALCEHCTNRLLGHKELKPFEYWAFAEVTTDEMADVLLKMKMRRPYTLPELSRRPACRRPSSSKLLDEMSYIGLIEYNWENPDRAKQWVLPMLVPGSAEFLNMRQSQIDEHPAVAKFFEQASKGALARATPDGPAGRRRHRHARHPRREGHRDGGPLGLDRAHRALARQVRRQVRRERVQLPHEPREAGRGLRRRPERLVHRRGRHGRLRGGDRPRPLHHARGGVRHAAPGRGQRLRAPDHQHRR
ncbi:MAG: hypothetical protein ACLTSX_12690 [Collinsella sp.]